MRAQIIGQRHDLIRRRGFVAQHVRQHLHAAPLMMPERFAVGRDQRQALPPAHLIGQPLAAIRDPIGVKRQLIGQMPIAHEDDKETAARQPHAIWPRIAMHFALHLLFAQES